MRCVHIYSNILYLGFPDLLPRPTHSISWAETHYKLLNIARVGQNHIYTVFLRYFWQGNHQIYGHIRCIYTVLANPKHNSYRAWKVWGPWGVMRTFLEQRFHVRKLQVAAQVSSARPLDHLPLMQHTLAHFPGCGC